VFVLVFAQSARLIIAPAADQPLLATAEQVTGLGPERFLTASERRAFGDAVETERRNREIVESLRLAEQEARWKGEGLVEESLRRIASYQQSFNEMGRGERFVQDYLRAKARARERWYTGVPALLLTIACLIWLMRMVRNRGSGWLRRGHDRDTPHKARYVRDRQSIEHERAAG